MFIVNKNVVSESYTDCLAISTSFPVPLLDPQEGKPDVGFRTFTTVGELSGYYSPVCGSPTLQVWDLIFIMLLPSRCSFVFVQLLLCLRMWYIFFGEGNGNPLQYSCLENPMDVGAWWADVHGFTKSRTWLNDFSFTFHFDALEKEMATLSVFLPGESKGRGSLMGFRLWDRTELDTTEAT